MLATLKKALVLEQQNKLLQSSVDEGCNMTMMLTTIRRMLTKWILEGILFEADVGHTHPSKLWFQIKIVLWAKRRTTWKVVLEAAPICVMNLASKETESKTFLQLIAVCLTFRLWWQISLL
jgi:hypothetical protein